MCADVPRHAESSEHRWEELPLCGTSVLTWEHVGTQVQKIFQKWTSCFSKCAHEFRCALMFLDMRNAQNIDGKSFRSVEHRCSLGSMSEHRFKKFSKNGHHVFRSAHMNFDVR